MTLAIVRNARVRSATRARENTTLAPPPPPESSPSGRVVPHALGNVALRRGAVRRCWCEFQYAPPCSSNMVPPMPVISGMLAGESTAKPFCAMAAPRSSQSPAPLSPEAANHVIPCAFACCAIC